MSANNFTERDMYQPASKTLRTRYPASEGWNIIAQDRHGTYIPDFVVIKKLFSET